ncbi:MAG: KaiA family protein [Cuspidothrix sp.]
MLVPILLLQTKIKQIIDNPFVQLQHQYLVIQLANAIDTITQWYGQTIHTTSNSIVLLTVSQQQKPQQELANQDNYFLAFCNDQKPSSFLKMNANEQEQLLAELKSDYREIVINYFISDQGLKEKIDKFINDLFYASIPVPQIIEIHMEVIDEFAKQLRLEGRSDETLLDYRLTLIDILAHLCEMYRCSIAKII